MSLRTIRDGNTMASFASAFEALPAKHFSVVEEARSVESGGCPLCIDYLTQSQFRIGTPHPQFEPRRLSVDDA